jgi:hypothetical protein
MSEELKTEAFYLPGSGFKMNWKVYFFAFAMALPAVAFASDDGALPKSTQSEQKVPPQFKLDLNSGLSPSNAPAPPPGTSGLTRETKKPFLGLKLTKPLGN